MRIRGRTLRASTLAERRLMATFGVEYIRVPRGTNPFVVARRFARAARCQTPDHLFVREVIDLSKPWPKPMLERPVVPHRARTRASHCARHRAARRTCDPLP